MPEIPHLDIAHLQRLLSTHSIGHHVRHEAECTSTNDVARQMLQDGLPSGSVAVAESQTRGRGRFQRVWTSAPGLNLLFSVLLRWPRAGFAPTWLTLAAALAVRHTVEQLYRLAATLKWPNDVVLTQGDGVQKLAGVLTEATTLGPEEQGAVVGIGLNVNQVWLASEQDPERPRISLAAVLGRLINREPLLAGCLTSFEERVGLLTAGRTAELITEARSHLTGIGKQVCVTSPGRESHGVIESITDDYHLVLRGADGQSHVIHVGEVLFEKRHESGR